MLYTKTGKKKKNLWKGFMVFLKVHNWTFKPIVDGRDGVCRGNIGPCDDLETKFVGDLSIHSCLMLLKMYQ